MLPQLFHNPAKPRPASRNAGMGYFCQFPVGEAVPVFFQKKVILFRGKDGPVFPESDDGWLFEYGNQVFRLAFLVYGFPGRAGIIVFVEFERFICGCFVEPADTIFMCPQNLDMAEGFQVYLL